MKRILVVDDDRASCNLLRELFTAQGWSAETAETPERALELAAREKFDLLVSDINLEAEMSGLDLLREMRDRAPVVLITGFGALDTGLERASFLSCIQQNLECRRTGKMLNRNPRFIGLQYLRDLPCQALIEP